MKMKDLPPHLDREGGHNLREKLPCLDREGGHNLREKLRSLAVEAGLTTTEGGRNNQGSRLAPCLKALGASLSVCGYLSLATKTR